MLSLDLVLALMLIGLLVGTRFRVLAMAPLAFVACVCALIQALTFDAPAATVALHVAATGAFFEAAYAAGALLTHGGWRSRMVRSRP